MTELKQQNLDFGEVVATILDGQTKSDLVQTKNNVVTGIVTPAVFDGTSLTFEVSLSKDNPVYYPLKNSDGTPYTITLNASEAATVIPQFMAGWTYFRLVSDAAQSGNDAEISIVGRPV